MRSRVARRWCAKFQAPVRGSVGVEIRRDHYRLEDRLKTKENILGVEETAFLVRRRVARLATADGSGSPYAVPVCYAYSSGSIYIALDEKPKDVPPTRLKRVRNILENPNVALIVDRYDEDWSLLAYVMVRGLAELLDPGTDEQTAAVRLLRGKYHQYEQMKIEENPVIAIRPGKVASWGNLDAPEPERTSILDDIRGRRSVRKYLEREVPERKIRAVLEAARWAPSPHGRQPWRFAVLEGRDSKERLADAMGEEWRSNLQMDGQDEEVVEKRLLGSREAVARRAGTSASLFVSGGPRRLPGPRAPERRDYNGRPVPRRRLPEHAPHGVLTWSGRRMDVRPAVLPGKSDGGSRPRPGPDPARSTYPRLRGRRPAQASGS